MKFWKVQKFFGDIVYDLRSRGLLPVLILLVVGMVAVPILISRGSSSSSPAPQPTTAAATTAPEVESAVVSYSPGLRDYKKRLDDLSAKDPFIQPAGSEPSVAAASQLSSTVTTPTTPTTVSGGSSGTDSRGSGTGTSTSSPGTTTTHRLYLYRSVADISVGDTSQPLERHKHIKPFTSLPNQVTPVIVYLGSTLNEKRAYFSLSKSASQLIGEGTCFPSPTDCSLLALGPGQTEDVVYSVDGKTYRVKVNKINLQRVQVKSSR
jgi:hypothetical protein